MAVTQRWTAASPQDIFRVLQDARYYGYWVVGSKEIRDVDPDWPAVGSRFHHRVGWGPLTVADHTRLEQSDPPRRWRLRAKARPLGTAIVTLDITPEGNGSRIVMREEAGDVLSKLAFNPLMDRMVKKRNDVALERLSELAEGRGPSPEQARRP